jgi:hypothetical protein
MSKGLGAVQRCIIEHLQHNHADPLADWDNGFASWTAIVDLAADDSRAAIESARRAVGKLKAAGVVDTRHISRRSNSIRWDTDVLRRVLGARLVLDPETAQRYQAKQNDRDAELAEAIEAYTLVRVTSAC